LAQRQIFTQLCRPIFSDYPVDGVSKLLCIFGAYIRSYSIIQVLQFFCQSHSTNVQHSYFIHPPSTLHNPINRQHYSIRLNFSKTRKNKKHEMCAYRTTLRLATTQTSPKEALFKVICAWNP
jgi:hypothetical protein